MQDDSGDVTARVAARVHELRAERGLSLEALAAASGVSRSMISLVERGESSPTAVVLAKLANGLGVTLGALLEDDVRVRGAGPVARRADQPVWRDPESGYRRRTVTPAGSGQPVEIVEIEFPAGRRVTFEALPGAVHVWQQVWVLAGTLEVTMDDACHLLREGDCLVMRPDRTLTTFRNPTRRSTRYAVVLAAFGAGLR